jgi:c-di-GMP-binding flagellar brake protein YcgR
MVGGRMRKERRRFFRIDDLLRLGYELLAEDDNEQDVLNDKSDLCIVASNFDNRIQTLLDAARIQATVTAELADLINKKLNFVIDHLEIGEKLHAGVQHTLRHVNIGACGISFADDRALEAGQKVKMDLVLQPDELHVRAIAEVVACEQLSEEESDDEGSYYLRFDFARISNADQELLIQHTVKRQSGQLRALREASEKGDDSTDS